MTGLAKSQATSVQRFLADEQGATAIEYALIAAGVGVTIASTVWGLGSDLKSKWYDKMANIFS